STTVAACGVSIATFSTPAPTTICCRTVVPVGVTGVAACWAAAPCAAKKVKVATPQSCAAILGAKGPLMQNPYHCGFGWLAVRRAGLKSHSLKHDRLSHVLRLLLKLSTKVNIESPPPSQFR